MCDAHRTMAHKYSIVIRRYVRAQTHMRHCDILTEANKLYWNRKLEDPLGNVTGANACVCELFVMPI